MDRDSIIAKLRLLVAEHGPKALSIYWLRQNERSLAFASTAKKVALKDVAEEMGIFEEVEEYIRENVLAEWRLLLEAHGLNALKHRYLEQNKLIGVLRRGERHGLTLKDAIKYFEKEEELKEERATVPRSGKIKWNAEKFDQIAAEVLAKFGCIPPTEYLKANGYGGFAWQFRTFGPIEAIRTKFKVNNVILTSLNHLKWLSMPEVAFCNYLVARGINVANGKKYPDDFSEKFNRKFAIYDAHFVASIGPLKDKEIKVEIFGGGGSSDADGRLKYEETKKFKLEYHIDDPSFIGIDYKECYDEKKLCVALNSFIGDPPILEQYSSPKIPTTMLSVIDQVVEECRIVCQNLCVDKLPSATWFARSENFKNRRIHDWEPKSYGRLLGQLGKIGYTTIQEQLGQIQRKHDHWDDQRCLEEFKILTDKHSKTASTIARHLGKRLEESLSFEDKVELKNAQYLDRRWREMFDVKQTLPNILLKLKQNLQVRDATDQH